MDLHLLDSMALANRVDYLGVQSSVYYGFSVQRNRPVMRLKWPIYFMRAVFSQALGQI